MNGIFSDKLIVSQLRTNFDIKDKHPLCHVISPSFWDTKLNLLKNEMCSKQTDETKKKSLTLEE